MTDTVKVKNISGEDLLVPWLGGRLVEAGQVVEVPAEDAWSYLQQAETWAPYDNGAKKAEKTAREEIEAAQTEEARVNEERFGAAPTDDPADEAGETTDTSPQED